MKAPNQSDTLEGEQQAASAVGWVRNGLQKFALLLRKCGQEYLLLRIPFRGSRQAALFYSILKALNERTCILPLGFQRDLHHGARYPAKHGRTKRLQRAVRQHTHVAQVIHLPLVRSEEHTSELQSLMRLSYAVFCLK